MVLQLSKVKVLYKSIELSQVKYCFLIKLQICGSRVANSTIQNISCIKIWSTSFYIRINVFYISGLAFCVVHKVPLLFFQIVINFYNAQILITTIIFKM